MLNCRHFNFLILVNNYVNLNLLVSFSFSLFTFQFSPPALRTSCACTFTRREKACKGTTFFRHDQIIHGKSAFFSAFFCQKPALSLFCHLDFAKFTLFFTSFVPFKLSYKHSSFNHLQTFSAPHFYLLKTLVFFTPIIPIFYLLLCLINYVSFT